MNENKNRIVYVQGVMTQAELNDLKEVTGKSSTKEALADAVEYRIMNANKKGKGK